MLNIDAPTTRASLPFDRLVTVLKDAFASGCEVPLRHNHTVTAAPDEPGTLLLMPAWNAASGYMGVKTVCVYPGNHRRKLPGLYSTYILYRAETGKPLALIDGNEITSRRTAAASALAASFLSRKDASSMLVLGAGRVASLLPYAYRTVRQMRRVGVWDIDTDQAHRLVAHLCADGFDSHVVDRLDADSCAVDIVSAATLSTEPLIRREYLRPGTHVDLIGGFTPAMREADDTCFVGTSVFVDTDEAIGKAGDLLSPIANGVMAREDIRSDLAGLCRARDPGRRSAQEITVFKAVGTALEDLAAAAMCFEAVVNH
ncbi:ornithine cyclodeaminase family protein [Cupriavidus consociatus]|uniref:ornithine cyclodeaminase family protein n=1 Tax=Cupriavidus consociatus TaxID=2821357 RepID=UPI001AE95E38|nr:MULTISPECIES: ornithine cyclodeaminase family protein [unclassified Cupriavidus]MBP0622475.1 ornithine cyclodeaminase family protein [Cupriavidus sp. LEh25]MDK2659161.1 ornithine cyclodeaminase family protein [Cupriavidus sp. LEh21]